MDIPKNTNQAFRCPHCGALAVMLWSNCASQEVANKLFYVPTDKVSYCVGCHKPAFWHKGKLVWPIEGGIPPIKNMPEPCLSTYKEAQLISALSPRAACALLRVALEQLVDSLLENQKESLKGKTLSDKTKMLTCYDSYSDIFDACRIVGNKAAHPAEISFDDAGNKDLPGIMSQLINAIVSTQITPRLIAEQTLQRIKKK